jgi:S1-C subfamily serine protease
MRISVTCPFCDKNGTLPDAMRGQRIKCAGCHQPFVVGPSNSEMRLPAALDMAVREEDHGTYEVRSLRRASTDPSLQPAPSSSTSIPVYVGLGIGAMCGLVLTGVCILMLSGPDKPKREAEPEALASTVARHEATPHTKPEPQNPPVNSESERTAAEVRLKNAIVDATVYLKLSSGGKLISSGTGFVIRNEQKNTVLLATNRRVADTETDDGGKAEITAVFRSGQGATREQSLPAEIVAIDNSQEMNHDLAILRVRGLTRPIIPIDPMVRAVPAPQLKYSAYGFPYADKMNINKGNPDITVNGGTISSLLKDEHGQLVSIKLNGGLDPGSSGGPLVDEKGRLIGVAVTKVHGVDNIGLAVPVADLRAVLAGRIGAMDLIISQSQTPTPDLRVKAQIVDPNAQIKGVKLLVAPAYGAASLTPRADSTWPPLPGAVPVELNVDKSVARGQVRVSLNKTGPNARHILIQSMHVDGAGKTSYSPPRVWVLPERDGRISDGGKLEELRRRYQRKSLSKLGPLVADADPKKPNSCVLTKDAAKHLVTISVPANQAFSLSPKVCTKQNKPVHNAPRTMAEIDGDFAAFVEVGGELNSGLNPIRDPRGQNLTICHQSVGLLVYHDKDNFMRLERACRTEAAVQIHELLVEVVRNGREVAYYYIPTPGDSGAPMILSVVRSGDRMKCLFSCDDGKSLEVFQVFTLDYPAKLNIGLCASNLSKKPLTAKFESFVLIDEKSTLEETFVD